MCRVLGASSSGYYTWRNSEESAKDREDQHLEDLIRVLPAESFGAYGIRRIVRNLRRQGIIINPKRIRRLMRKIGVKGKGTPKRHVVTTDSEHTNPVADNHLDRQFVQLAPNKVWVTDITYIWTEEGWLYLAVVIDLFSRAVVGWATSKRITAALVCLALQKAIVKRNPDSGLVLHSDRGIQYTCEEYRNLVNKYGLRQSMSRKGNCWDNAVAESFFRSLKVEAIKSYNLNTRSNAAERIFKYIEGFYNTRRAHSFLNYLSPLQFELSGQTHQGITK